MRIPQEAFVRHLTRPDWLQTPQSEQRGYIDPQLLKELWFHTGTICNLSCPFCLEGSKPGDDRLNKITFDDAKPFIDEALGLGVEKFSFTGGEPFVIKDIVEILDYALDRRPCLVLTNATKPLNARLEQIKPFLKKSHPLNFRVSFDYPDEARHDAGRGKGSFQLSWQTIAQLHDMGFQVSIARHRERDENIEQADKAYQKHFQQWGLPSDTRIVSFPDFLTPGSIAKVPHITEQCMTTYHTEETRDKFMCNFSKMVVKHKGKMRVYACTLVDDDIDYDLGSNLQDAMRVRVMLKHHRCYSCFAQGASCSEG
ncbi:MAG: radical SAM protein [Candidatus Omnitrophica bacterium]|nr:radical SAM protein [Candidatus Omnitrophota bacterium]